MGLTLGLLAAGCLDGDSDLPAFNTARASIDLWSRTYGYSDAIHQFDISESLQATIPSEDGGFLAIGFRRCAFESVDLNCHANGQTREPRIWAVKVNDDGSQILWEKAFSGFKGSMGVRAIKGNSVAPGPTGETYIIAGIDRFTPPGLTGNPRLRILQLDYLGNVLSDTVFAPPVQGDEYEQVIPMKIIRGIDSDGRESGWLIVGYAIVDEPNLGANAAYKNRGFMLALEDDLSVRFFRAVDRGLLVDPNDPLSVTSDEQFYSVTTLDNRYVVAGLTETGTVGDSFGVRPLIAVYTPDGALERAVIHTNFEDPSPGCRGLFAVDIHNDPANGLYLLLNDNYRLGTQDFSFDCADPSFYIARLAEADLSPQTITRYHYDFQDPSPVAPRIHGASEFDFLSNDQIAVTTHHNYLLNEYGPLLEHDWSDASVNLIALDGTVVRQLDYGGYATHDTIRELQQLPDGRCLLTGSTDLVTEPSLYSSPDFDPVFGAGLTFSRPQDGWLAMDRCDDPITFTTANIATGPYPLLSGYFISLPGADPSATIELLLSSEPVVATAEPIELPDLKIPENPVTPPPSVIDAISSPIQTFYP
ncbi:MAG TPA: hypothetical protein VK034_21075 [Enhygromyxa sp.]|nr:hypothetical protein [Enhygromyxa sp.]